MKHSLRSRLLALTASTVIALALIPLGAGSATATIEQAASVQLTSPLASYNISSHYGNRCPIALGAGTFHAAVDLASAKGNQIFSVGNGVVDRYVTTPTPMLFIDYGDIDGKKTVIGYAHMDNPVQYVKLGQKVSKGQHIADVSDAGIANGPHLHFEVSVNGKTIDPIPWMKKHGVNLEAGAGWVAKRQNPTRCQVYTTTKTGLVSNPKVTAQPIRLLNKDTPLTLYPGKPVSGTFNKVTTTDGKTGYIHAGRTYTSHAGDNQPAVTYGTTAAGVTFRTLGNRYLFTYPGVTEHSRGIAATVPAGEYIKTTGRTANGYIEITWNKLTGWVPEGEALVKDSGTVQLSRFWSAKFDNAHFFTANEAESSTIRRSDSNWAYEGTAFRVWTAKNGGCAAGQVPVYRFYSSHYASHFFTVNKVESDTIRRTDAKWSYEGVAFCETNTKTGTEPVYRFWSPKYGKHFYTTNMTEMAQLRDQDPAWDFEGVAWYAPTA